jgi:hypothetical protein
MVSIPYHGTYPLDVRDLPPSTFMIWPLIVLACSDVRKMIARATSSTVAILCRGMFEAALFLKF